MVYDAYVQRSFVTFPSFRGFLRTVSPLEMSVVLRTAAPLAALQSVIPAAVREVEPELPVTDIRTETDQIATSVARERMFMRLLGAFLRLRRAARVHRPARRDVVRGRATDQRDRHSHGTRRAAIAGAVADPAAGRRSRTGRRRARLADRVQRQPGRGFMLYGLAPRDVMTMAGAALVLVAVALAAAWLPVRRAVAVDPDDRASRGLSGGCPPGTAA